MAPKLADDEPTARLQHPDHLAYGQARIWNQAEHGDRDHQIEGVRLERQGLHVAVDKLGLCIRVAEPAAGGGEHAWIGVQSGHLRAAAREAEAVSLIEGYMQSIGAAPNEERPAGDEAADLLPCPNCEAVGIALRKACPGKVVNIADWAGHRPYADFGPYCASKAAMLCDNKLLAKSLAPEVRVNAVLPGPVLAPESMGEPEKKKVAEATLLKRLGTPEAVARACLYLAESADYSTGAELTVDGGRLIA